MADALQVQARRYSAAPQGNPLLEMLHHPLYSSAALAAAAVLPQELSFFSYGIGQPVAGAGAAAIAATEFHTNMTTARQLSQPRTYLVQGLSIDCLPLTFATNPALADQTNIAAVGIIQQYSDIIAATQASWIKFSQGDKVYLELPAALAPSNLTFKGLNATSLSKTSAGAAVQQRSQVATVGKAFTFNPWPVLLAPGQSFDLKYFTNWSTNTVVFGAKLLVATFHGIMGREVL